MNRSLILSACCLSGAIITGCSSKLPQKPNIVFINADDIGIGDLECYGTTSVQTPNVNRLAGSGKRFVNAYSCAATSTPSQYGLLTGLYPWRRNDTGIARGDALMIIHKDQYTVASLLNDAGYSTAAVGKWHLGLGPRGDAIVEFDWSVGQIVDALGKMGLTDNTLIILTSDNGPVLDDGYKDQAVELVGDHKPAGVYRGGNWKYITPSKSERINLNANIELGQDTVPQLYNLKEDAGERKNIAYENMAKVKELSLILESIK